MFSHIFRRSARESADIRVSLSDDSHPSLRVESLSSFNDPQEPDLHWRRIPHWNFKVKGNGVHFLLGFIHCLSEGHLHSQLVLRLSTEFFYCPNLIRNLTLKERGEDGSKGKNSLEFSLIACTPHFGFEGQFRGQNQLK